MTPLRTLRAVAGATGLAVLAATAGVAALTTESPKFGNPLWAIPLSALTATQDRPLFTPSRTPPPKAVAAAPVLTAPPPVLTLPLEPLPLSLIGAVVGEDEAIAVFVDKTTQQIVRLRAGQSHAGWSLSAISPREATLTRGNQTEQLVIKRNESSNPPVSPFTGAISPPPSGSPEPPPSRRKPGPDNL